MCSHLVLVQIPIHLGRNGSGNQYKAPCTCKLVSTFCCTITVRVFFRHILLRTAGSATLVLARHFFPMHFATYSIGWFWLLMQVVNLCLSHQGLSSLLARWLLMLKLPLALGLMSFCTVRLCNFCQLHWGRRWPLVTYVQQFSVMYCRCSNFRGNQR